MTVLAEMELEIHAAVCYWETSRAHARAHRHQAPDPRDSASLKIILVCNGGGHRVADAGERGRGLVHEDVE